MRILLVIGLLLVVVGVLLLFVPIPHKERHGFDAGGVSVGVTTTRHDRVPPLVSAVVIAGGVVAMILGARAKR